MNTGKGALPLHEIVSDSRTLDADTVFVVRLVLFVFETHWHLKRAQRSDVTPQIHDAIELLGGLGGNLYLEVAFHVDPRSRRNELEDEWQLRTAARQDLFGLAELLEEVFLHRDYDGCRFRI